MRITEWFQEHKVAANLLMLTLWVLGISALLQSKKEILPVIERSFFIVETQWPGHDNASIETRICKPLELIASQHAGVFATEVIVQNHLCHLILHNEFELTAQQREALFNELRYSFEHFTLPPQASPIQIIKQSPEVMLARFTLSDESNTLPYQQLLDNAERLQQAFIQAGLSNTKIRDARKIETHINISEYALSQHQLSLSNISQQIKQAFSSPSLGTHAIDEKTVSINISQEQSQLDNLSILKNQNTLQLKDIAEIQSSYNQPWLRSQVNGKPAISISIYQTNKLSIDEIQQRMYQTQANIVIPPPLKLTLIQDNTIFYQNRMNLLKDNALLGLALVFFVLTLFLQLRAAFWVCVGIPTAFISSFICFYFLGTSINMVSTFAFLLIIGVIVDDAIMVAEHLSQQKRQSLTLIIKPLVYAVLTTAISFSPLLFIPGAEGQLIKQIPIVVLSCLFFSLVECLCILPAHLKHTATTAHKFESNSQNPSILNISQTWLTRLSKHYYRPFLETCLTNKYAVLSSFIALFIISISIVASGWKPITLHSNIEAEIITVNLQFPDGANPAEFSKNFERIEKNIINYQQRLEQRTRHQEIDNIRSEIIANGLHGNIYITIPTHTATTLSSRTIAEEITRLLVQPQQAKSLTVSHTFTQQTHNSKNKLRFHLAAKEQKELIHAIHAGQQFTDSIKGVNYSSNSLSHNIQSLNIELNSLAKHYQLDTATIALAIQTRFETRSIQAEQQLLRVQLPLQERSSLWHLGNTIIPVKNTQLEQASQSSAIPLKQLANLTYTPTPASSHIKNGRYTAWLEVHFDSTIIDKKTLRTAIQHYIAKQLVPQFKTLNTVNSSQQNNEQAIIKTLLTGFIIAIMLMYISMALLFNSYLQPIYVLTAIPFGIIGSLIGHLVLFEPLTIWSITGMIAVSGIVVNDNIVLVHFINNARQQGCKIHTAILEAGQKRFRPIFLTTITSFIGLLPMLLESSFEAQFLIPMAISLSFGILFATAISLILVPILYSFSEQRE